MRAAVAMLVLFTACGDDVRGDDICDRHTARLVRAAADRARGVDARRIDRGDDRRADLRARFSDRAGRRRRDPARGLSHRAPTATRPLARSTRHDVLGAQYGVAAALENLGFRFRHPFDTLRPERAGATRHVDAGRRAPAAGPRARLPAPHAASDRGLLRVLGARRRQHERRAPHHRLGDQEPRQLPAVGRARQHHRARRSTRRGRRSRAS